MLGVNKAMPGRTVTPSEVCSAVDRTIPSFYKNEMCLKNRITVSMECDSEMQSEIMILFEMNVDLWEVALQSALRDITLKTYPHYKTIRSLFDYILNDYGHKDFGLTNEIFARLNQLHPSSDNRLRGYYRRIIVEKFKLAQKENIEEENLFWKLIDALLSVKHSIPQDNTGWEIQLPKARTSHQSLDYFSGDSKDKNKSFLPHYCVKYFDDLPPHEQLHRINICLKLLCDILEVDLFSWMQSSGPKSYSSEKGCILSSLLWPDTRDIGQLTSHFQKLINLHHHIMVQNPGYKIEESQRLLKMAAELIRTVDRRCMKEYPFFGECSLNFSREIAVNLLKDFRSNRDSSQLTASLRKIKSAWFQLLCCCHVLGNLAGFHCQPELLSASMVLEHMARIVKESRFKRKNNLPSKTGPADPVLVAKFGKLKSVNAKYVTGLTRLHTACRQNRPDFVRALLTFSTLDLNQVDNDGWTPLHDAAARGHNACVELLLEHVPPLGDAQLPVNCRARGPENWTPLICAAQAGHLDVCELLLKHSGSILLEDVTDDNQTAMDLCTDNSLRSLLSHYQTHKIETIHSGQGMSFSTDNLPLVVRLCAILVHNYFATHRTWDVYHEMKRSTRSDSCFTLPCQYSRYHRDFKTNLPKLRSMVMNLQRIRNLSSEFEYLHAIVSLNK